MLKLKKMYEYAQKMNNLEKNLKNLVDENSKLSSYCE